MFLKLSASLASLALGSTAFSSEKAQPNPLALQTFTASESGFLVNSHLVVGKKKVLLIDAQFTKEDATKLADTIEATGKELESVFISHGHPDHYFGLETIQARFPKAKLLTTPEVLEDMKETAKAKFDYWKPIYKENLASKLVFPVATSATTLSLEGQKIEISQVKGAEAHSQNVLRIPSLNALFTGDLVYSGVHLWLAEGRPTQWKQALNKLKAESTPETRVFPGHGSAGGVELLEGNIAYIEQFEKALQKPKAEDAKQEMKRLFPKHALPIILDIAVDAAFASKGSK
jgi:glyoxylase-like metal-dependent hydrolase (beta-lactamase superfamily II)